MSQINVYLNLLEKWLFKKRSNREILKIVTILFGLSLLNSILTPLIVSYLKSENYLADVIYKPDSIYLLNENLFFALVIYFTGFFFFALVEEIIFRLPILLFIKRKIKFIYKLILIVLLSIIFSIGHISEENGILIPIFVQGLGGILFSFIFIIAGASQDKYLKALLILTLIHFINNIIATINVPISALIEIIRY
jgi:membrane protease YdiL (CAAX protease family)